MEELLYTLDVLLSFFSCFPHFLLFCYANLRWPPSAAASPLQIVDWGMSIQFSLFIYLVFFFFLKRRCAVSALLRGPTVKEAVHSFLTPTSLTRCHHLLWCTTHLFSRPSCTSLQSPVPPPPPPPAAGVDTYLFLCFNAGVWSPRRCLCDSTLKISFAFRSAGLC